MHNYGRFAQKKVSHVRCMWEIFRNFVRFLSFSLYKGSLGN